MPENLPPAFEHAAWVAVDDALWAGVSDLVRRALDFASLIVADFPALCAEFGGKRFRLLWRGSRNGFGADDFYGRCDGHAPTLTLIEDTDENIFGGFTPVEWESRTGGWIKCLKWESRTGASWSRYKADPSLESFTFTLRNPYDFPGMKFELKAEKKDFAILCGSKCGPCFCGLAVSDHCNANTHSGSCLDDCGNELGISYANDTCLRGNTVLTGSRYFTVKEIEVFEIAD